MLDPIKTNLTVLRYRGKRLEHSAIVVATVALLAVSVYNILLGFQHRQDIFQYEEKIARLQQSMKKNKKESKSNAAGLKKDEIESIQKQIVNLNRIIAEDVYPWSRLLETMEQQLPYDVTLERFATRNRFRNIDLSGQSKAVDSVSLFLSNLEASNLFETVELTKLNLGQSEQILFNIQGRVDMEALLPVSQYGDLWKLLQ